MRKSVLALAGVIVAIISITVPCRAVVAQNQYGGGSGGSGADYYSYTWHTLPAPASVTITTAACGQLTASLVNQANAQCVIDTCTAGYLGDVVDGTPGPGTARTCVQVGAHEYYPGERDDCCDQAAYNMYECLKKSTCF